jgi:CDP-diacylglycerol--glycerol-3-phosphate 3-phosphatidyltransferase
MQMVALTVLIVQHDAETLRLYHVGEFLLVAAGVLTIWSGLYYVRAAWPALSGDLSRPPASGDDS